MLSTMESLQNLTVLSSEELQKNRCMFAIDFCLEKGWIGSNSLIWLQQTLNFK